MALAVYKYPIPSQEPIEIDLPRGAEILSFHAQNDSPCLWALVDVATTAVERRKFHLIETGHRFPAKPRLQFIGTALLSDGALVFHLFEEPS